MQSTNTSTSDPSKIFAIPVDNDNDIQFVRCVKINHNLPQEPPQRDSVYSQARAVRPDLIGCRYTGITSVRSKTADPASPNFDQSLTYTRSRSAPHPGRSNTERPLQTKKVVDQFILGMMTDNKFVPKEQSARALQQTRQAVQSSKQQDLPTSSTSKRKSVDNSTTPASKRQATVNISTSNAGEAQPLTQFRPKKLWLIPAYDPAKDKTKLAHTSTSPPIPFAELPSFQRCPSTTTMGPPIKPASANRRRNTASLTTATKPTTLSVLSPSTTGRTGLSLQPHTPSTNPTSPFSPNYPPLTPLLTPSSTLTPLTTTVPTPTPTRRTTSTPWTSSAICQFIQGLENSFDFHAFAAEHNKTRWEVAELWSAIVALPLMAHADKGLARARMAVYKEKKRTYDKAVKEMAKVHKEEARAEREAKEGMGKGGGKDKRAK